MIDISFILPTNRNPANFSSKVIDNIKSLNFGGMTFEIIVVTPTPVDGDNNVRYIKDDGLGCVDAYNKGYNASSGEYIFLCSDDHFFHPNAPLIVDQFDSDEYLHRKYKVICLPTNNHGPCNLPSFSNCNGLIARYPVYSRDTIENYLDGYIYHPSFKHHYPDNWLGYWLTMQGEPVIEYHTYDMKTFSAACDKQYDSHDEDVFKRLITEYENGYKKYT